MRRIVLGLALGAVAVAASGCGGRSIYRNVGDGRPALDPAVEPASATAGDAPAGRERFEPGPAPGGLIDANAAFGPRFSRGAVSDAEMLRNNADAGYRDGMVPY
jgi:hypothetical protein